MTVMPIPSRLPGRINPRNQVRIPHAFDMLQMHPKVAATNSPAGKTIRFLQPHKGTMLIGYGDWTLNLGPVAVCGYDLNTKEPVVLRDNVPNEAWERIKIIDGDAYLTWTDPRNGNTGGFTTDAGGTWHDVTIGPDTMIHTYDIVKHQGKFIVCGSILTTGVDKGLGVVWQQQANGSWTKVLEGGLPDAFTRFYRFNYDGDGYIRVSTMRPNPMVYKSLDGANWTYDATHPGYPGGQDSYADPRNPLPQNTILPSGMYSYEPSATVVHDGKFWFAKDGNVYISRETFQ